MFGVRLRADTVDTVRDSLCRSPWCGGKEAAVSTGSRTGRCDPAQRSRTSSAGPGHGSGRPVSREGDGEVFEGDRVSRRGTETITTRRAIPSLGQEARARGFRSKPDRNRTAGCDGRLVGQDAPDRVWGHSCCFKVKVAQGSHGIAGRETVENLLRQEV